VNAIITEKMDLLSLAKPIDSRGEHREDLTLCSRQDNGRNNTEAEDYFLGIPHANSFATE